MRSIFAKILLWFLATLIVCLAGFTFTTRFRSRRGPGRSDFFSRELSLQVSDAEHAYTTAGKSGLEEYLRRLDAYFPGKHSLVDRRGTDLLSGTNRSGDLAHSLGSWGSARGGRGILAWPSKDGQFRLVIDGPRPPEPASPIPFYIWMAVATVLFCYFLAVQLASPLRALEKIVEGFGRGDLSLRAPTGRRDEIGKLARTFNEMADRIESLLTSERRLLQDVSHELRSPLARLTFAVELARAHPDQNRALGRIRKEIDRLTALVSELLQATRADSDQDAARLEHISLQKLLQDLIDDSAVEIQARGCRFRFSAEDELVVNGDPELIHRAVDNVVRNAIRYAPENSTIDIFLRHRDGKAVIAVRDYGPGVPDEALNSLFRPFFRVEADRNRNDGGGVGLGLSIAERAVRLHQGEITALNAFPGLEVRISLPLVSSPVLALR